MIKKLVRKNISKIWLSFVAITVIVLVAGYFSYQIQEKMIIENRYNQLKAIKELKVNQILNWRQERIGDANSIIKNPFITSQIKKFVQTKNSNIKKDISSWLALLKSSYKYEEVILVDKDHNLISSSNSKSSYDKNHSDDYNLLSDSNDITISPIHDDGYGNIHITFGLSFRDETGVYAHMLIFINPNNFLFPLIQNWPTPSSTAETILATAEGDSVVFINELRHKSNTALNLKIPLRHPQLPAAEAVRGRTGLYRGLDYRGVKVLSDIGPIPGTDWFIVAKIDEEEIFGSLQRALYISIALVIMLLAGSYLFIIRIWRKSKLESLKHELELQKDKLRLSNLYATLSQINQTIVREQSKPELLLTISKLPVEFGNFEASAICMLDESSGRPKIESFHGSLDYFSKLLNDASEFNFDDPAAQSASTGKTKIFNKLHEEKNGWQSIALQNGINACAASPISPFGKTIGSFVLYSNEENFFQLPEIRLIEEIASDISFSLEAIEKNERRKEIEKQIIENGRQLTALFENLPGIAYRCKFEKDWVMEFMSDGTLNVTGYTPEEIVEQKIITYDEIIHPDDLSFVRETLNNCLVTKKSFTIIYRIKTRDGETRWVWERAQPVINTKGKVLFVEGLISDITETKEAQDQLKKSEEYFRYLFHNNPLPMWIYDLNDLKFLEVNIAAINKYGYSESEFKSMTLFDIRPQDEFDKLKLDLQKPRIEQSESSEWKHTLKNGMIIDVLIISHKIEFDKKPAVLVAAVDITDRKKAARELVEAKEKAEAGEKLKSDFLAQMSHEIRTPVNVILSFSSLIKEAVYNNLTDDLKEGFSSINHAGQRLIRTIDSILNMSQITRGVYDLQLEVLDVFSDVIKPLHNEFLPIAAVKNLKFVVNNNCSRTLVNCDRYSVSQIFANIIDNAIKYTEQGSITISINCKTDTVVVAIADTGIGISENYLPKLFHPFSQEETGYSRGYEGTGLGLALVKNYCDMNNADISVTSKKGEGTIFTITLNKYSE